MTNFENKVILITGASSGIGAGAARHLGNLGAKLALVGRNATRLNEVAQSITAAGSSTPLVIAADVQKDAERIINDTISHFGKLDVLVNNAGIYLRKSLVDTDMSAFDEIFSINTRSVVELTKLAVPHLEKSKGNIVNVSSISGLRPYVGEFAYCMSKAALDQFTKCASLELGPKGIRVNSINPGAIITPIYLTVGYTDETAKKLFEEQAQKYPIRRVGVVDDTSAAIAFLASDAASFITGVLLPIDGGVVNTDGSL